MGLGVAFMNFFKNKINQREYAYLITLLWIISSYLYRFGHFDIHSLTNTTEAHFIIPKIILFIIFGIIVISSYAYVALCRVNDTKISKWSLLSLLIPYVVIIYSFVLIFLPSTEKINNSNLIYHIGIVCITCFIMNAILFGMSPVFLSSIFLVLFFLFVIFIIDIALTNIIKLFNKFSKK